MGGAISDDIRLRGDCATPASGASLRARFARNATRTAGIPRTMKHFRKCFVPPKEAGYCRVFSEIRLEHRGSFVRRVAKPTAESSVSSRSPADRSGTSPRKVGDR